MEPIHLIVEEDTFNVWYENNGRLNSDDDNSAPIAKYIETSMDSLAELYDSVDSFARKYNIPLYHGDGVSEPRYAEYPLWTIKFIRQGMIGGRGRQEGPQHVETYNSIETGDVANFSMDFITNAIDYYQKYPTGIFPETTVEITYNDNFGQRFFDMGIFEHHPGYVGWVSKDIYPPTITIKMKRFKKCQPSCTNTEDEIYYEPLINPVVKMGEGTAEKCYNISTIKGLPRFDQFGNPDPHGQFVRDPFTRRLERLNKILGGVPLGWGRFNDGSKCNNLPAAGAQKRKRTKRRRKA